MYTYLKPASQYEDRYDLFTIQDCLQAIESHRTISEKRAVDKKPGAPSREEVARASALALNLRLFFLKGERYRNRSAAIRAWMERDRRCDETLETAREPANVSCPACAGGMAATLKELVPLEGDLQGVLFVFECRSCGKRKGIYANGEPFVSSVKPCPQCKGKVKTSYKKKGTISTFSTICSSCGFREDDIYDPDKEASRRADQAEAEKKLLAQHRHAFCLSPEEGGEYLAYVSRLESLGEFLKCREQQARDPNYQKLASLKRLSIVELEKRIAEAAAKDNYKKLILNRPDIGRHVIVPFVVQDAETSRKEHESTRRLQRSIKRALEGTNWRLMSEGIFYKLGYLTGRLKGYDLEEDLLKLVAETV